MATVETQGTIFRVGNGDSPLTYTVVGGVTGISGLRSGAPNEIDVTDLSSTAREFLLGLKDEGTHTVNLNLDPADTGQQRLATLRSSRAEESFQIELSNAGAGSPPTGTTYTYQARVSTFPFDLNPDDAARAQVTIRVTGDITETPAV